MAMCGTLALMGTFIPLTTSGDISTAVQVQQSPLSSLPTNPSPEQIKSAIVYLSSNMGVSANDILKTLICESGLRYNAKGDWNGKVYVAYGPSQFHKATWDLFNKKRGTHLSYYNAIDQVDMTVWAFKNGLQSNWSCYNQLFT